MDWKIGLDKYLTAAPDDNGFDGYAEQVTEAFPDDFFKENEDWILDNRTCNKWLGRCFDNGYEPTRAAAIIQRAFYFHNLYMSFNEKYGEEDVK